MKQHLRKIISVLLTLSLLWGLAAPAAASEALGEDLTEQETLLNRGTTLSTGVFWSSAFSDLRTENVITYRPNDAVTPVVTYGSALTEKHTVSAAAKELEGQGYRVVAGINGDYYNVNTGLPVGMVVTEGVLRSSDAGHHAVGFRADGTAVLGKPAVQTSVKGYLDDGLGTLSEIIRQVAGINKARVSTGGIYLYTYDFNDRHTTGNTEPGVDVVCSITDGTIAIGETVTLTVEQVIEATAATAIGEDQVVLSVNLQSDVYYVDALRRQMPGDELTLTMTPSDEAWNDVEYAVGALYSLVENGTEVSGLPSEVNPRTAVGQKADGTLVFYTIDGRRSGHSIGASMPQVAKRLVELGCVTAVCLDGGGSTTLSVTRPDAVTAERVNRPSGAERAVSNQIFLVADGRASGTLSHYYVEAEASHVLAGSKVAITASAVDTKYVPMNQRYTLSTSAGTLSDGVLTTPVEGGEITVTASGGGKSGSATVYAIASPDAVAVRNSSNEIVSSLTVMPGTVMDLSGSAAYNHLSLKSDQELFAWSVEGEIGTIDENGVFTAGAPGTGAITVAAGGTSTTIPVTVTRVPLKTLEDFEAGIGTVSSGMGLASEWMSNMEYVRLGRGALRLDYTDLGYGPVTIAAEYAVPAPYTSVNLWVRGDGTQNSLRILTSDGETVTATEIGTLEMTEWTQYSAALPEGTVSIVGFQVEGITEEYMDPETGAILKALLTPDAGFLYIDHLTASFDGTVDNEAPLVTVEPVIEEGILIGTVADAVDGILPDITVTWDGTETEYTYNSEAGVFTTSMISDGKPHRITVTAKDASGNIGRASYDVPVSDEWVPIFSDTQDYWAAAYVDFLYDSGVTTGYTDGTFRPNQNIIRAQFAAMLYRYLKLDESLYTDVVLPFADVDSIAEYAMPAVKALYTEGVINGTMGTDGALYFNPNGSLTRAQAAAMIGRTQEKGYATAELTFSDVERIPAYASYYIQTMAAQGVLSGYADGTFKPNNNITRGQMAKILYNLV